MNKATSALLIMSVFTVVTFQNCNSNTSFSEQTLARQVTATGDPDIDPTAVDAICIQKDAKNTTIFPPAELPLKSAALDSNCTNGFEMNNLEQGSITLNSIQSSSSARRAFIEVATYAAPDALKITAIDSYGNQKMLFFTCRMQTADYPDPTSGNARPPDDSIRQYKIVIPAGTKRLIVDGSDATSPTYMKFAGLCDFNTADAVVKASLAPSAKATLRRYIAVTK